MAAAAQMPQHTITILLGLVFCIMNPIITPVCLIYFMIITITEKYNLLYVYTFEYQSGGQASPWPSMLQPDAVRQKVVYIPLPFVSHQVHLCTHVSLCGGPQTFVGCSEVFHINRTEEEYASKWVRTRSCGRKSLGTSSRRSSCSSCS